MALDIHRDEENRSVDLTEKGRRDGQVISLDRRLFMHLLVFRGSRPTQDYVEKLREARMPGVFYEELNDPRGFGVLTYSEDPAEILARFKSLLNLKPFKDLELKPQFSMLGRTYSIGYESDLERTLITRPIERVTDPSLTWAIWYPLRRSGAFDGLSREEQRVVLMEHGGIGRAYGEAGLAYDIRLACHGLDQNDNDFVVGLLGHKLHPLSKVVERMRKTKQTSQYLSHLGPFFVGKAVWQRGIL
jgi:chlorite dismutase